MNPSSESPHPFEPQPSEFEPPDFGRSRDERPHDTGRNAPKAAPLAPPRGAPVPLLQADAQPVPALPDPPAPDMPTDERAAVEPAAVGNSTLGVAADDTTPIERVVSAGSTGDDHSRTSPRSARDKDARRMADRDPERGDRDDRDRKRRVRHDRDGEDRDGHNRDRDNRDRDNRDRDNRDRDNRDRDVDGPVDDDRDDDTDDRDNDGDPSDRRSSAGRPTLRAALHPMRLALHTLPVYLASRAAVVAGAAAVAAELQVDGNLWAEKGLPNQDPHGRDLGANAVEPMLNVFTSWDGRWYMDVVRLGYPKSVPSGVTYLIEEARTAFFPLFPALGRLISMVLPGGDVGAVLAMNLILGFIAIVLVGLLAERLYGEDVARRATTLMAFFPGSFVFSFAYSEALMLTLAAGFLLVLLDRRWWFAGILGALVTATRPNGVAVVFAAFVAFVIELRKPKDERDYKAAIPMLVSPLGFIAFQAYLAIHTGEPGVWFRVQREAWDEGASFGWTAIRNTFEAVTVPLSSPTDTITALSLVATIVLVYFAIKVRLNPILSAYSAVILALMLLPATVTARPRFLFTAFPLLIAAALWIERRRNRAHADTIWNITMMLCGAGLAAITTLYGVYAAIP